MEFQHKLFQIRHVLLPQCKGTRDQRERVLTRTRFALALIFGCILPAGKDRSIDGLCREVKRFTRKRITRCCFHKRLNTKILTEYLMAIFSELVKQITESDSATYREIARQLSVRRIVVLDSTNNSLPDRARETFPGPRTNKIPASIKVHGLYSLTDNILKWVHLSPAKMHDRKHFPETHLLVGSLVIFDLAYWDHNLLSELNRSGVYFLTRVKNRSKIMILEVIQGLPRKYKGWGLFSEKVQEFRNKLIEVICRFHTKDRDQINLRVVGFWNPHEQRYFWYVTNLTCRAQLVYPLYRLRWQIELFWKENKSLLLLNQINSGKPNIIKNLILATLIASIVFGPLSVSLLETESDEVQIARSVQRAALVFDCIDFELFNFLDSGSKQDLRVLLDQVFLFTEDLFDPNYRNRSSSMKQTWELMKSS